MATQTHLFAYGTLMLPEMVHQLLGRAITSVPGTLHGYACYEVKHQIYPAIIAVDGSLVSGLVYQNILEIDLEKLDQYEGDMYERTKVKVELADGRDLLCQTYVCKVEYQACLLNKLWTPSRISPEGLLGLLN